ncbi:MAG TPA: hypothetical protein VKZ53_03720 [Candidatus Angelobacter sp.]|nr:hypothetical protein [Candidatus Angelobacter sp.]
MALEDAPKVDILPFDEEEAYDHDRPISSLIRTQLLHLHTMENLVLPLEQRTDININDLHTERLASEYIHKVTDLLHRHGRTSRQKAAAGAKSKPKKKLVKKALKKPAKKAATKAPGKPKPVAKKRASRR